MDSKSIGLCPRGFEPPPSEKRAEPRYEGQLAKSDLERYKPWTQYKWPESVHDPCRDLTEVQPLSINAAAIYASQQSLERIWSFSLQLLSPCKYPASWCNG